MRWPWTDRAGTGAREPASEGTAAPSGVAPGQLTDVRLNGEHAYLEVRVSREHGERLTQGQEVIVDGRRVWYLRRDAGGTLYLRRRDDVDRDFYAIFPNYQEADRKLAEWICEALNEREEATGER